MSDVIERLNAQIEELQLTRSQKKELIHKLQAEIESLMADISDINTSVMNVRADIKKFNADEKLRIRQEELAQIQATFLDLNDKILKLENLRDKWLLAGAKDYQLTGAASAVSAQGFLLADTMGLGKTFQSIIAADMISNIDLEIRCTLNTRNEKTGLPPVDASTDYGQKVLYVCPKTLIQNVKREFEMWDSDRKVFVMEGNNYAAVLEFMDFIPKKSVVITNYEVWRRNSDIVDRLKDARFGTLIVDESHNLKNTTSMNFRKIKEIATYIPFRILMTGTPILNRPDDIFTTLNIITPNLFTRINDFNWTYCRQKYVAGRLQYVFQPGGYENLIRNTGSIILKRSKEDVGIELPPITIEEHLIDPAPDVYERQWNAYSEMRTYGLTQANDEETLTAAAYIAILTRLRQICILPYAVKNHNGTRLEIQESQKLDYVYELVGEITRNSQSNPEGERTVIFSQFTEPLHFVQKRLEEDGFKVAVMIGETSDYQRNKIMLDFDTRTRNHFVEGGHYDVLLCNYKVGGVGLNLTDATQIITLDNEWSPGKRDQAHDRLHRPGQTKPVTVHKVLVDKTVDRWMEQIMDAKAGMLSGFENDYKLVDELKALLDRKEF